jgi:hypothetical protein
MTRGEKTPLLACALTTPELRQRKATILEGLRTSVLGVVELESGYSYTFPGTDAMVREVSEFIVTERACCGFFTFTLVVEEGSLRLDLTGPEGVKEFILRELELPLPRT